MYSQKIAIHMLFLHLFDRLAVHHATFESSTPQDATIERIVSTIRPEVNTAIEQWEREDKGWPKESAKHALVVLAGFDRNQISHADDMEDSVSIDNEWMT